MFLEYAPIDIVLRGVILSSIAVFWIVLLVRVVGLRAFSKMTAFDFVVTVSIGSLLAGASQSTSWLAFFQTIIAIGTLLGIQYMIAALRKTSKQFDASIQNCPVLLMEDGKIIHEALEATRVSRDDLIAKLREANTLDFADVRAVVLETTGDISVLKGDALQDRLLTGVCRVDGSKIS